MITCKAVRIALLSCMPIFFTLYSRERIDRYHVDLTIHTDGHLDVIETITVWAQGQQIKRGIYRDFPTVYKPHFFRTVIPFDVISVRRDDQPLVIDVQRIDRGRRVYMRGNEYLAVPRQYTFELSYTTARQIGFFNDHDELYWNVVGADWTFPVMDASITLHLPEGVTSSDIKCVAYAGSLNSRDESYQVTGQTEHSLTLACTKRLKPFQAFTLALALPKGSITPPSKLQQWQWFIFDNGDFFFFCCMLLLMFWYFIAMIIAIRSKTPEKRVIPLFEPPDGFTPGMVRYFIDRDVVAQGVAGDIVHMAVNGWITIEQIEESSWFSKSKQYVLRRTNKPCDTYYQKCRDAMFPDKGKLVININARKIIKKLVKVLKETYTVSVKRRFFVDHEFIYTIFLWIFAFGVPIILVIAHAQELAVAFFGLGFVLFSICWYLGRIYTSEGFKIRDQIEGFKLYLSVAESERLKFVSTPPTRTPELYERYLPYAIVLGVEEQWTEQFAPVFDRLMQEGTPYTCLWYHGHGRFDGLSFSASAARELGTALGATLASTTKASAPGSSSGFGRGGGAGRGGGGGGGGGC